MTTMPPLGQYVWLAGPALDCEIAVRVMGYTKQGKIWYSRPNFQESTGDPPCFSSTILRAWEVADKLGIWFGRFTDGEYWAFASVSDYLNSKVSKAPTAPLAVCRCALKVVGA